MGGFDDFIDSWAKRYGGDASRFKTETKKVEKPEFCPQAVLELAQIDENYKNAKIGDFCFPDKYPNKNGLFIFGNIGVGKTHYSWGLYKELLIKAVESNTWLSSVSMLKEKIDSLICFVSASDIMLEIYDTFNGAGSQNQIINKYSVYPLLIIDDLSSQRDTEFYYETFLKILDKRMRKACQTIINSNLNLDAIYNKNNRLGSRLHSLETLYIGGVDRRKSND